MASTFSSSLNDDIDFSFVYDLDEDSLNMFFEVIDLAVITMTDAIQKDIDGGEVYLSSLTAEQNSYMFMYYSKLLELYTEYELYEECEDIKYILDNLKRYQEKVGNMK